MGTASMPHAIGPRAKISACIAGMPLTAPYSVMVALGYWDRPTHGTPNVEHVMASPDGLWAGSNLHSPSMAWYGMPVSNGMPPSSLDTHSYAAAADPPSHEPGLSEPPQLRMAWMAKL